MSTIAAGSPASVAYRLDWLGWLVAAGLLAAGVFGFILPDTGWFTAVPGDIGDARFNSYILEHLYRVVTGEAASLWDPEFFYPFTGILGFSDNHLGSSPSYLAARLLGLGREHAFDAWFLAGAVLNFGAALYALRRMGLELASAAIGAFVFAFALPALAQDGHAQLVYRFGMPLAALALWESFETRRVWALARVAFWTTWQFYCAIYLGIFLLYLLLAMSAALLLLNRPLTLRPWREAWARDSRAAKILALVIIGLCAAALAYLLGNYLIVSRTYRLGRPIEEITSMIPRWASYLLNDRVPYLKGFTSHIDLPVRGEHQLFIGFAALALVVAGALAAVTRRTPHAALGPTMFVALALLVIGTLWIRYFSFYYLIAWLPGISSMRAVSRVILVMLMPISVLVAIGATALSRQWVPRFAAPFVAVFLALLVAIEPLSTSTNSTPISTWRERVEKARALLPDNLPADAILWVRDEIRTDYQMVVTELDGMLLAQELGLPTLNGYSGYGPPGYLFPGSCNTPADKLAGYAHYTRNDVSALLSRVVTIDLAPCEPKSEQ